MLCLEAGGRAHDPEFMQIGTPRIARDNDERRRHLRYAVRCHCWLESDESTVFGPTADVALGGVFLRTAVPLIEGQRVRVALTIERKGKKGQPVIADGVVTRAVRAQHGLRHGVGVAFLDILHGSESLRTFLGG
jgi:hypothetical protein